MTWKISYTDEAIKNFKKLDRDTVKKISRYLNERVANAGKPTTLGKPLSGTLAGKHRYRVGDYRVICKIKKQEITVLVLRVLHRSRAYK